MNPDPPRPPSDAELDQLLASRLSHTSPEFELRWRELRGQLTGRRRPRTGRWSQWLLWPGLATGALVAVALVFTGRNPSGSQPTYDLAAFENLIELDAMLTPAVVLLEPENREALLHLPSQAQL